MRRSVFIANTDSDVSLCSVSRYLRNPDALSLSLDCLVSVVEIGAVGLDAFDLKFFCTPRFASHVAVVQRMVDFGTRQLSPISAFVSEKVVRSEEHTSELQSLAYLVC